ncbi:hypothetical protein DSECCO2_422080 [anaerobic digester metagenome]
MSGLAARNPEMTRLGGVPIRVMVPPRIDPKARGIRIFPGGRSSLRATWMATGISRANAPTLFMNADRTAPSAASAAMLAVGLASPGSTILLKTSTAPESCRARLSTSTQATVTTAGWPKPAKAAPGATKPKTTQTSNAPTATMSCRHLPQTNMPMVPAMTIKIVAWSWSITTSVPNSEVLPNLWAGRNCNNA